MVKHEKKKYSEESVHHNTVIQLVLGRTCSHAVTVAAVAFEACKDQTHFIQRHSGLPYNTNAHSRGRYRSEGHCSSFVHTWALSTRHSGCWKCEGLLPTSLAWTSP